MLALAVLVSAPALARSPAPPVAPHPERIAVAPGCIPPDREPPADLYVSAGASGGNGSSARPLGSLADALRRAGPGATVLVRPGVYREGLTVERRVKLLGVCGAVVKGSDVWEGFQRTPEGWSRPYAVALHHPNGTCTAGTEDRCRLPSQVFVDGRPLGERPASRRPQGGEFVVRDGRLILGLDPAGRRVEVSARTSWVRAHPNVTAEGVIVRGFTMLHAASGAQRGGIDVGRGRGWVIEGNDLSLTSGAAISLVGDRMTVRGNRLHHNGEIGLLDSGSTDSVVERNEIWGNNTDDFLTAWESGGAKFVRATGLVVRGNHVHDNKGRGLWCDIDCLDVSFEGNRVHHNYDAGIASEISRGCVVRDNVVYENGNEADSWGWGAGIMIQNSSGCDVRNNVVAWNADGIVVVEQERGPYVSADNLVRDNVIASGSATFQLGWLSDKPDAYMFELGANNRAERNRYHWDPRHVPPWEWNQRPYYSLEAFAAASGERSARRIALGELRAILARHRVPLDPERPAGTPVPEGPPPPRWSRPR